MKNPYRENLDARRKRQTYELVGRRIFILRNRENMPRSTLAKLIGISVSTLENYEAGGEAPFHVLKTIAEELNCTLDYFAEELNAEERDELGEVA